FYDEAVSSDIKERAEHYLGRMLDGNVFRPKLMETWRLLIRSLCNRTASDDATLARDIRDSRRAGFVKTSMVLDLLSSSALVRSTVKLLFGRYYKRRIGR